ncbi:sensor histidine kinase [Sutterella sp.]|uniref:sensor histidine kinase n=1 Tax=Sutterella sp. TaxID=1981025 RepID=UPI0026E012A9|nr:sensor histidine kinase [Sutterella sp.]
MLLLLVILSPAGPFRAGEPAAVPVSSAESASTAPDGLSAASQPFAMTPSRGGPDTRPVLSVAVIDTLINPFDTRALESTIGKLGELLPQYRWQLSVLPAVESEEALLRVRPDFLLAPSGFAAFTQLSDKISAVKIATRRTVLAESAERSVGAAFVVRSDRPWRSLSELKGRSAATGLPDTVEGWLAAAGEISRAGFDPDEFFATLSIRSNAYPDVFSEVLSGATDVGIIPACLLETVEAEGLAAPGRLRVIHEREGGLACRHSTDLYPGIGLIALSGASEEKVRDVLGALLSLHGFEGFEWFTNVSDARVLRLFEELRAGPWAHLRDMSPMAVFSRYKHEILLLLAGVLLLVLNELRLHALVRRRTADLRAALEANLKSEAEAADARQRLAGLERRSVVHQMSGMVAHEVSAPIGAIRAYTAVLRLLLGRARKAEAGGSAPAADPAGERLDVALSGIEHEAAKIAGIIDRVRSYARAGTRQHQPVAVGPVLSRGLRAARAELTEENRARITLELEGADRTDALVTGDALELEVLFLNLIRNAASAALNAAERKGSGKPVVIARLEAPENPGKMEKTGDEDPREAGGSSGAASARIHVIIENTGEEMTDDAMARLASLGDAIVPSPTGLGIGLGICRGIIEGHGASMKFARRPGGGVRVRVTFPAAQPEAGASDSSPESDGHNDGRRAGSEKEKS